MIITVCNIDPDRRLDIRHFGGDIVRDAPDTGLDVQFKTSIFRMRVRDVYIKIHNKETKNSLVLWDCEFRSIDVR